MARYISDTNRVTKNPCTDPANPTGEIRWITASSVREFNRILELSSATTMDKAGTTRVPVSLALQQQTRRMFNPEGSHKYRTKTNACISIDEAVVPLAVRQCKLTVIPDAYFMVACKMMRLDFFVDLWHKEERGEHPKNPARPTLEALTKYLEEPIRYHLAALLDAGLWVDDPWQGIDRNSYENPEAYDTAEELEDLNKRFQRIGLSPRQSHMPFSSAAKGTRRMFGQQRANQSAEARLAQQHPDVAAYLAASPDEQQRLLAANRALPTFLRQAGHALPEN